MADDEVESPFSQPVASTSSAVLTLSYKPPLDDENEDEDDQDSFSPDDVWVQQYESAWAECSSKIHSILSSLHDASLDEIVTFVNQSQSLESKTGLLATLSGRRLLPAGLIVGASPSSSALLFSSLVRQLQAHSAANHGDDDGEDDSTPGSPSTAAASRKDKGKRPDRRRHAPRHSKKPCLVSRLTSRECPNIKSALRSIIAGFIGAGARTAADEDDDVEEGHGATSRMASSGLKGASIVPEDMQNLTAWYAYHFRRRKHANQEPEPTLVILLEDLEGLDGKVLSSLIETLSHYVDSLPLVLLLGVATSAEALHQAVWRGVANLLDTSMFFVEPGMRTFETLMKGLLVDWDPPLSIGPQAFSYLLQTFQDLHQSVDATVNGVQSLYMHHFSTKAIGMLTVPAPAPSTASAIPDAAYEAACSLPSLQRSRDNATPADADRIDSLKRAKSTWHAARRVAFELVLAMLDAWGPGSSNPTAKSTKWSMDRMLSALMEGSLATELGDELCTMILHSPSSSLPKFFARTISRLEALHASSDADLTTGTDTSLTPLPTTFIDTLRASSGRLDAILALPRDSSQQQRQNLVNQNVAGSSLIFDDKLLCDADREYTKLTKEVSTTLQSLLRQALTPSDSLTMHEIWFANDLKPLERFHPSMLSSVQRSLQSIDPAYLAAISTSTLPDKGKGHGTSNSKGTAKAKKTDVSMSQGPTLDVAVAYRLYRETGKSINLSDWWRAFEGAAWDGDGDGDGDGKRTREDGDADDGEEDEDEDEDQRRRRKQARFLRALGDLAYVGFVQPTARKPEHVNKSIF